MESTDLESHTSLTSDIVQVLYFIFLVLSVIMLVNILVALLTNTFERYRVINDYYYYYYYYYTYSDLTSCLSCNKTGAKPWSCGIAWLI